MNLQNKVPTLQQFCLEIVRNNLQCVSGVKGLPSIFQEQVLNIIIFEIKSIQKREKKWEFYISLSRSVKKFVIQSIPCKTLATKILNIRTKKRVLRLLSGSANFETVVRECIAESSSSLENQNRRKNAIQKKKERNEKQFKIRKNRYEKKLIRQLRNSNGGLNKKYHKVKIHSDHQWKCMMEM